MALTSYTGMSVAEANELRKNLERKIGSMIDRRIADALRHLDIRINYKVYKRKKQVIKFQVIQSKEVAFETTSMPRLHKYLSALGALEQ